MRARTTLAAIAALLILAAPAIGHASSRLLVSGKLDAAQSYDFSCSVVNKNPEDTEMRFEIELKDADGNVYVNPSTFQLARLEGVLQPGESAMLVAPAGFVGVTSLYCWALVTEDAEAYGTFLVRDAQDRATAAVPLGEDIRALLSESLEHLEVGPRDTRRSRLLASAKLDASQSFDFSCSAVNKAVENWEATEDHVVVVIRLKNADGSTYVNPSTFQEAVVEAELEPGEAAMLVAPAAFVGVTSLYCWVAVFELGIEESPVFGTFLVRDAQDRATAATPLQDDINGLARRVLAATPEALQGPGDGQRLTDFPLPPPSNHGLSLAYEICGDGTIADLRNKLLWEIKLPASNPLCVDASQANRDVRCLQNVYTWTDVAVVDRTTPDGTVFTEFITALNTAAFAGFTDWRLPHIKELHSLSNYAFTSPAIAPAFGPTQSNAPYWSATTNSLNEEQAMRWGSLEGTVKPEAKDENRFARAVRTGKCAERIF